MTSAGEVPIGPDEYEEVVGAAFARTHCTTNVGVRDYFFDGFGFAEYMEQFGWTRSALNESEERHPPERPLLPYLERLNSRIPKRYDLEQDRYVENEDWLILNPEGIG